MAWDAPYALEGIYLFGGPLNVHQYMIDSGPLGLSTETTHVVHFLLDDDRNIELRLMGKMRGPIEYFPVLYLLGRSSISQSQWKYEKLFFKPWLYSLQRNFWGTSPANPWIGPTLGIACNRKDNPTLR